ncbi:MAG: aminotransferase class III-fold pyridoxal phosphate-dependent enzyme, partial [Proteobacteria bacterium]|nr:aminotransferase class III-fold pyridoxal phosphate-dependent enzyme [Pseudomonadota bacterium]
QRLEGLVASHPDIFVEVRGSGLMLGIACKVTNMDVVNAGYDAKVLTVPGGANVIRLLPPLNISNDEIDEAVARLEQAATAIEATL